MYGEGRGWAGGTFGAKLEPLKDEGRGRASKERGTASVGTLVQIDLQMTSE
jgi:hypothetical protein